MAKIKICGITRSEDIEALNILLPDYAGFVFAASKRKVSVQIAENLIRNLDKRIKTVGVFVNEDPDIVAQTSSQCGLDILQFHGNESPAYCNLFYQEVWKAFQVANENSFKGIESYEVEGIVLDAFHPTLQGGSGLTFDWKLSEVYTGKGKMIMAGGLTPDNVIDCIRLTMPDVVDVSSGVETDGLKDYVKIEKFIKKVRKYK